MSLRGRILFALLAFATGLSGKVLGQCQLVTGPTKLACPDCETTYLRQNFYSGAGWLGLYHNSSGDRLMVPMSWGSILYSLASPAFPSEIRIDDLRYDTYYGAPGVPGRDGQNYANGYGVSSDGQRNLYSLILPPWGTVVSVPSGNGFAPMGDTGIPYSGSLVVQKSGSRYIAYGLNSTGLFFATDVTTLTGYDSAHPIPAESPALFGMGASGLFFAEGNGKQFLYAYNYGWGVTVVDVSNPGPTGSITRGFSPNTIPPSAFGLQGQTLVGASVTVDPVTGNLYVLGSFWSSSNVPSYSLLLADARTLATTPVGTYSSPIDSGYRSRAGLNVGTLAVNTYTGDVIAFMWFGGSFGLNRLYATSVRNFGSPISQWADINGTVGYLAGTTIFFKSQTDTYAYFWDGNTPWAMQLSCQAGPVPAAGHLSVSNISTGSPLPVASGDTILVGETLSISPSVTPSNSVQPVTAWNLDFDYHAATETTTGPFNTQLLNPDACLSGCSNHFPSNPDPPVFTLVGPCDPRGSGNPTTGSGCWGSVGIADFSSSQPAAGTTRMLPIAFEASNTLNTTTVPLATFNINWKVPAVRVQNLSALLNSGSALFTDASEGHPLAAGYKWYFGTGNTAPPSEPLAQDIACTGSSCNHTFAAGKGTYNAWLLASYKNGYSSPDCTNPCGGAAGSFRVTVTDFTALFTAPASGNVNSSLTITNNSQIGGGVTGIGYLYTLCDASSGPCSDPGDYQPISGMGGPGTTGTITAPPTAGTWWLRIRATYNTSSTAQWQPNTVSDPTAWPITVSSLPSAMLPTSGTQFCTVGGCQTSYIGTACTPITVALFQGSTQLTQSVSWSVSGGSPDPPSGTGSTFTFTPKSGGATATVSVSGITPLPPSLAIAIQGVCPPPPVGVTLSASDYSPAAGSVITLTASPSGGTGSYPTFDWDFNDGTSTSGGSAGAYHAYAAAGSYTVTCTVHDSGGATANGTAVINVQPPAAMSFYTVTPCRVVDTRSGSGFPSGYGPPSMAGGGAQRSFAIAGQCGIPAGAKAVSLNAAVWAPVTQGDYRIFPAGGATPNASTMNWEANILALANAAFMPLGAGGAITVQVNGAGTVDLFIDVNGYFQ